jgi:hypothetical protein
VTDTGAATIEAVGGPQAAADLRRWADQLPAEVTKASGPFAEQVADSVRARVPVLTGTLAGSVTSGPAEGDEGVEVSMGAGVVYAGWIEFGGSRGREYIPEGRYVYPTALEPEEQFAQAASEAADHSIERFSWSTPSQ